jgi:uncharacterized protein YvpB
MIELMVQRRRRIRHILHKPKQLMWRYRVALGLAGLCLVLVNVADIFIASTQRPVDYIYQQQDVPLTEPIRVSFTQDVASTFNYNLSPGTLGSWKQIQGLFGTKGIEFTPDVKLSPAQHYSIDITGLKRVTGQSLPDVDASFTTAAPAIITSVAPVADAQNVPTDSSISVTLDGTNKGIRRFELATTPAVDLGTMETTDDVTFRWKPPQGLVQGQTYQVALTDLSVHNLAKRVVSSWSFSTVSEPVITTASTTDHLNPGDKLSVVFAQPMKHRDGDLDFKLSGSGQWTSDTTYEYSPKDLKPGTGYDYVVHKGITSVAGGVLQADQVFHVSTPGAVYVTGSSPGGGGVSRATPIKFSFDQAVDHASAQSSFSINPSVAASFSWSGNTMTVSTPGFEYQTGYTATLASGIKPVFGLASAKSYSTSFTTQTESVRLSVPLYFQVYPQSCEEAALRMALAYRGIAVTDFDVLVQAGYNPRSRDAATNSWDNPYRQFVGDVNGSQRLGTGYGVFSDPIAQASRNLGRNATAYHGVNAAFVSAQIHAGNPVVVWGYTNAVVPYADSWNTSDGLIATYFGEHTRTVTGVDGSADNPVGFYINDPAAGKIYWSASQLNAQLGSFGAASNQAVVVY